MAMGCPHQGRSGGLNATITSRPFDSPRPSPGGYRQCLASKAFVSTVRLPRLASLHPAPRCV